MCFIYNGCIWTYLSMCLDFGLWNKTKNCCLVLLFFFSSLSMIMWYLFLKVNLLLFPQKKLEQYDNILHQPIAAIIQSMWQ